MGLFIAVGLVGLLFFLVSALFGHHDFDHSVDHPDHGADHGESGPSAFSAFCIAWTMMGFGSAGTIASYYQLGMPLSTVMGACGGAALWSIPFSS